MGRLGLAGRGSAPLLLFAVLAGCGDALPVSAPPPTRAVAPADWVVVTASGGDLQLTLPPWLVAFDTQNAIFANQPPGPDQQIQMQLMAWGPRLEDSQPRPEDDLGTWIDRRLADPGAGVPVVTGVRLPAGTGVRYQRIDRFGTPLAWQILAVAIRAPSGVAYVQIDGSPAAWPARAADIELVLQLLRTR